MNANDVHTALLTRWPDSEYLSIREAPQDSARQGRKLDLLVVSLWQSRGFQLDGIEIKVSMADAKRELFGVKTRRGREGGPEKADWWWRHVDRFWLAAPEAITTKLVADEHFPEPWGLLGITEDGQVKTVKKAPRHEPEPLAWSTVIGLMRASADAGLGALHRASEQGYRSGKEAAKREFERRTPDGAARQELDKLREIVDAFEKASGIKLSKAWAAEEAERIGRLYALAERTLFGRHAGINRLEMMAQQLTEAASQVKTMATEAAAIWEPAEPS